MLKTVESNNLTSTFYKHNYDKAGDCGRGIDADGTDNKQNKYSRHTNKYVVFLTVSFSE